mgnify:CR=1 FL=1
MGAVISFLVIAIVVLLILSSCIRIVPQAQALVVERLGAYLETWSVGVHFKVPFIDRVAKRVILKEQVVDFAPQPVITKDNVTMKIDTVVFFQITDPKLFAYGVENPIMAIENLTATTLRNIIGDLELDQTLTSRETINTKMRAALDVATDPWGIKVNRVELKNIIPPAEIQNAMERQMKAEREKREKILRAEGEKEYQIKVAQGEQEAKVLRAEADKKAAILHAEAEKEATILRGEAIKEQKIRIADGEARSIEVVQQALADSLVQLNKANPNAAVLQLKALELLMLLERIPQESEIGSYYSAEQTALVHHLRDHLLTNREGYVSLAQLAAEHEMSVSHLQKLFKQVYGVPVYRYIKEYRLEQAAVELVRSRKPITEIAQHAGYDNASKFSACFKERYGVTPSQYRTDAKAKQSIGTKTE